jgi:hypothetical protein
MNIGIGLSTSKDSLGAVREAVQRALNNLRRDTVDLAIVFSSAEFAHYGTLKAIGSLLGPAPIVGCSAQAIISREGVFERGIIVILFNFPAGVFCNTACVKDLKPQEALKSGILFGEKLLYGSQNMLRDLAVIFSDRLMEEGQNLVYGLQEKLGKSFPLIGAAVSSNTRSSKGHLYFHHEVLTDAAFGILWGGKLSFGLGIKHGWKPLGKPRTITKAVDNIAYEIDGKPAAELYEEYLDCDLAALKKELKHISVLYPIGIYLQGGEEYLLRNVLGIQDDGSLALHGNITAGSKIRLMIGTKESCIDAAQQAVEEAKKGLLGRPPNFALIFESISRYKLLRRDMAKEIEAIKAGLGKDVPIAGICTHGEQAPLKTISYHGEAYFHNQSIAILTMGG